MGLLSYDYNPLIIYYKNIAIFKKYESQCISKTVDLVLFWNVVKLVTFIFIQLQKFGKFKTLTLYDSINT